MANFVKQKMARESAGEAPVVPDGIELPAENIEAVQEEIESDTREITVADSDHELLASDIDETDEALDATDEAQEAADARAQGETTDEDGNELPEIEEDMDDDAVESVAVAQEARQKRWGLTGFRTTCARESYGAVNKRKAVRESLWDDIKAFLRRVWEWIKEQGRKVKDRWLKFSNQGKAIQKRSKKFDAAIRGLGAKDKDDISGSFIKQLSKAGKFVGADTNELNANLSSISATQNMQKGVLANATSMVNAVVGGGAAKDVIGSKPENREYIGNYVLKVETTGAGDEQDVKIEFIEREGDVETSVATPTTATMNSVNTFFNKLGIEIEKDVKNYRQVDSAREAYEKGIEKLLNKVDNVKLDGNEELAREIRTARRYITNTNSFVSTLERKNAHVISSLSKGVNGYLAASIAAYKKSK